MDYYYNILLIQKVIMVFYKKSLRISSSLITFPSAW